MDDLITELRDALRGWDVLKDAHMIMERDGIHFDQVLTRRAETLERLIKAARAIVGKTGERK